MNDEKTTKNKEKNSKIVQNIKIEKWTKNYKKNVLFIICACDCLLYLWLI